jgi:Tfp pilus assembly protein PilN
VIEVNLLPGGKKGSAGGFSFKSLKLPSLQSLRGGGGGGGMPGDPYQLFLAGAAAIAIGYMAWSFLGVRGDAEELAVRLEEERQDSIELAQIIGQTAQLQARGDSIAARVQIIQDIDADRYTWAHLLDEVAAAVPDYTWLREVLYQSDDPLTVRLAGRAGSIFAITNFTRRLEASRFLRNADPETIQQVPSEENPEDMVYLFELVVTYDAPPLDELETVPLFEESSAQTAAPTGN